MCSSLVEVSSLQSVVSLLVCLRVVSKPYASPTSPMSILLPTDSSSSHARDSFETCASSLRSMRPLTRSRIATVGKESSMTNAFLRSQLLLSLRGSPTPKTSWTSILPLPYSCTSLVVDSFVMTSPWCSLMSALPVCSIISPVNVSSTAEISSLRLALLRRS